MLTLLSGLARRYAGVRLTPVMLAGGDGFVLRLDDAVIGVVGVEITDGRIAELNLVVNPAKLPPWPLSAHGIPGTGHSGAAPRHSR